MLNKRVIFKDKYIKYVHRVVVSLILVTIVINFINKNFTHYVVKIDELNIKESPSNNSKILTILNKSDEIKVIKENLPEKDWVKIEFKNSYGFVIKNQIEEVSILSKVKELEILLFKITGLIIIFIISFVFPYSAKKTIFKEMGFKGKNLNLFLIGLGLLMMMWFLSNPIFLTIITILGFTFFLILVIIDSYFLNEMIRIKIDLYLLKKDNYDKYKSIINKIGYVGILLGVYQFVISIINTDWQLFGFNDLYISMNNDPNDSWTEGLLLKDQISLKYFNYFRALIINIGSPIFSIITNFFLPWSILTSSISFLRIN